MELRLRRYSRNLAQWYYDRDSAQAETEIAARVGVRRTKLAACIDEGKTHERGIFGPGWVVVQSGDIHGSVHWRKRRNVSWQQTRETGN
jgi:hypothetical protein